MTKHSQACLNTGIEPPWVTKGRTLLIMKNIKKGGVAGSYISIVCLTIMWQFLTEINVEKIYYQLESSILLQNQEKRCRGGSRKTKDQFEQLREGKEKSSHLTYRLQGSV